MSGEMSLLFFQERNFQRTALLKRFEGEGHDVAQEGPSYLVHRYEEEPDFPKQLNGRFHGLVADKSSGNSDSFQ